jgi:hypothetical protein
MALGTRAGLIVLVVSMLLARCAGAQAPAGARPGSGELPPPPGLAADPTIWPNAASCRNSDPWLSEHHDSIKEMRPRVLVLNFANDADEGTVRGHAEGVIAAFREATRYHGYEHPEAPSFLKYEIVKLVDLRDDDAKATPARANSSRMPVKKDHQRGEPLLDYAALFSDEFASSLGFADPRTDGRFLNLRELVHAGYVHEVWFYAIHDPGNEWPGNETCEEKQYYDAACRPIDGKHGPAGNGHDRTMPWIGRSIRVAFFNPHRGPGCSMENFGHTMEWMASTESIEYYHKYFFEFANFDLDTRYGLPFGSFYRTSYERESGDVIEYPRPDRLVVQRRGKEHVLDPFITGGGSAHFPPGARWHYDLESPATVLTTLETYRTRAKPEDKDAVREFTRAKFARYGETAPDCMGAWIVYWFQSMPGLGNRCIDDEGKPMKNWWVFLFY